MNGDMWFGFLFGVLAAAAWMPVAYGAGRWSVLASTATSRAEGVVSGDDVDPAERSEADSWFSPPNKAKQ